MNALQPWHVVIVAVSILALAIAAAVLVFGLVKLASRWRNR